MLESSDYFERKAEDQKRERLDGRERMDRYLMDAAVHAPIITALAIACAGWAMAYGTLALVFIPIQLGATFMMSRAIDRLMKTWKLRRDVGMMAGASVFAMFCFEAYGVHLGLVGLNALNATLGVALLPDAVLIAISLAIGVYNVIARRGMVTGLDTVSASEWDSAERKRGQRINKSATALFDKQVSTSEARERYGHEIIGRSATKADIEAAVKSATPEERPDFGNLQKAG